MAEKTIQLEIVTPETVVYSEAVETIKAPGKNGYLGILHNHIPFMTALKIGRIEARVNKTNTVKFATSGGFIKVMDNKVTVVAETAENADKIDSERAQQAKQRAEERLKSTDKGIDSDRARFALMKALNRLDVLN